ncbi:hypothetical protein [Streptomyces murinus]|uniref:hypothetical protein n=1 Tax=Streptomyces murinus TaxID=33900 RepID=UPI0038286067
MKQKNKRARVGSNPARVAAVQDRRRSGASGFHASRRNPQRDRRGVKLAAIRYSSLSG